MTRRRIAVVLGAGSSRALNAIAPLDRELLDRIQRRLSRPDEQGVPWARASDLVKHFLNDYYRGTQAQLWDALMLLDTAKEDEIPERDDIRDVLESQVCGVAADVMQGGTPGLYHGMGRAFVQQLKQAWTKSRHYPGLDFITMNYDLVIDGDISTEANGWQQDPKTHLCPGYEKLYALQKMREGIWRGPTGKGTLKLFQLPAIPNNNSGIGPSRLLKVHGSVNWLFCTKCDALRLLHSPRLVREMSRPLKQVHCPKCGSKLNRVLATPAEILWRQIVCPSWKKRLFKRLWKTAATILENAEAIIFVGYSLPPEDRHVRQWLAKANKARRRTFNAYVVTHGHEPEVEDRYRSIFGKEVEFFKGGLIDCVNEGVLEKDEVPRSLL